MNDFNKLTHFIGFTNKFREIIRTIDIKGSKRRENDAEHSFQLAITALFLIDKDKFKLNKLKVLEYALLHDLVEIHAGDVYFLDHKSRKEKETNEKKAFNKISSEFPEFTTFTKRYKEYEAKANKEARFIYALDKIIPVINIVLNDGKSYHIENVKFEDLMKDKRDKIKYSDELKPYFEELLKMMARNKNKLFPIS